MPGACIFTGKMVQSACVGRLYRVFPMWFLKTASGWRREQFFYLVHVIEGFNYITCI